MVVICVNAKKEREEKELANICLNCPLKHCRLDNGNTCKRYNEEKKRLKEKLKNDK